MAQSVHSFDPDYTSPAARQLIDIGRDPRTGEPLRGTSGITLAWNRANQRMLQNLVPQAGARTVFDPNELNNLLALRDGSGSPYDTPSGGEHYSFSSAYKPLENQSLIAQQEQERENYARNVYGFDPRTTTPEEIAQQKFENKQAVNTAYRARQQELQNRALSQGQRLNPSRFHFNAGGTMTRDGETTQVPSGIGDGSTYMPQSAIGTITRGGTTYGFPRSAAPSFVPPPDPNVIDQRKPDDWISPRTKSLNGGY